MSRLMLLSCSQRKRAGSTLLPAIERYDGPAFRILRRFQQQQPDQTPDIFILSAKFGLISPGQLIPNYDQRMTPQRASELRSSVIAELGKIFSGRSYHELCVCMGQDYLLTLDGYDYFLPPGLTIKTITGSLGKQSAELHDWLYGKPPAQRLRLSQNTHQGKLQIRGIDMQVTLEQVFDVARQALLEDPKRAASYQSWYVLVDEQRIAPKWLVSRLTGLPVNAFVTDDARRVLAGLGVEVRRV